MKSEVVIIGGGGSGLAIAYCLANMGIKDITLVEKHYLGSGSTFRCATGIRASFTTEEHIVLQKHSIELWREWSEKLGFFYERGGYVWLFRTEEQLKAFKEFSKLHNSYGVPTRIISPEEVKELVPTIDVSDVVGALLDPIAGKADPFGVVHSLARACRDMGVKILTLTSAEKIVVEESKVKGVETNRGFIESKIVVLAAGYGSRELAKTAGIDLPLENIPHHSIITEKFKPLFKPLVIDWTTGAYIVQTCEGNFLMGVDIEEKPNTPLTPRIDFIPTVVKIWYRYFKWLPEVYILRSWSGYYVMSPDRHPILGPVDEVENMYLAVGYSGHGFMMAPIVGKLIAEWIVDGKPSIPQANRLTLRRIKEGKLIYEKAVVG